ncbi:MAG: hypothetical protein PVH63_07180 [Balneolaceae bacterium]|jgi:hypothetical protein
MNNNAARFSEYYSKMSTRGFKELKRSTYRLSYHTHLTFSNGEKCIYAAGGFVEEALTKIFDNIDQYHAELLEV